MFTVGVRRLALGVEISQEVAPMRRTVVATAAIVAAMGIVPPAHADPVNGNSSYGARTAVLDTGPTHYRFDNHVRFITGSKLSFDDGVLRWPVIAAWYRWRAWDPDGICYQFLGSEEYTTDYPQFGGEVPPSVRRAKFHVIVYNGEDPFASSFVEFTLEDCEGNQVTGSAPDFNVDRLQEDEMAYRGHWRTVRANRWSGGAGRTAREVGATVTFNFWHSTGLLMPTGPLRGTFDLYVDGVRVKSVNLQTPKQSVRRVVASVDLGNGAGGHTAMLKTTSSRPVTIDAALIS